jgi:hypothetical protein
LPDGFKIPVGDLGKADPNSKAGSSMSNFGFGPSLILSEPKRYVQLRADFNRNCHLDVTSSEAKVGDGPPERSAVVDMYFNGILAPIARMSAPLGKTGFEKVSAWRIEREVPERLSW